MLKYSLCIFVLFTPFLQGRERYRLQLTPLDFSGEDAVYLTGISQIESNGSVIYLRSRGESEIFVIAPEGNLIRRMGGKGGHPSEFGSGVLAMAVRGNQVWAIDYGRERVRWLSCHWRRAVAPRRRTAASVARLAELWLCVTDTRIRSYALHTTPMAT